VRRALGDEDGAGGVFDDGTGDRKGSLDHHGAGRKRGGVAGTIPGVGGGGDFRRRQGERPGRDPSGKLAGTLRDDSGTVRGRFEGDSRTFWRRKRGRAEPANRARGASRHIGG
jgi:hypothetical protein